MSSRLIYICAVILLVGIQEIRAQQRDTIVIHDTVYVDKAELEQVHAEKDIVEDNTGLIRINRSDVTTVVSSAIVLFRRKNGWAV